MCRTPLLRAANRLYPGTFLPRPAPGMLPHVKRTAAFSIVELTLALALAALLAVGAYRFMKAQGDATSRALHQSRNLRDGQRAQAALRTDIAQAGFDPRHLDLHRDPIDPVTLATPDLLTLQGDFDMSGTIDPSGTAKEEVIRYSFQPESGTLLRNNSPILTGIDRFSFSYSDSLDSTDPSRWDSSVPGARIAQRKSIRRIRTRWSRSQDGNVTPADLTTTIERFR